PRHEASSLRVRSTVSAAELSCIAPPAAVVASTRVSAVTKHVLEPASQLGQIPRVDAVRHRRLAVSDVGAGALEQLPRAAPELYPDDGVVGAMADRHRKAG